MFQEQQEVDIISYIFINSSFSVTFMYEILNTKVAMGRERITAEPHLVFLS
jgi:hypothetical protein